METEKSFYYKGKTAYIFEDWERQLIAKLLAPEIKKLEKKIEKIKDNPKNEGQATYLNDILCLRNEISSIQGMIAHLT